MGRFSSDGDSAGSFVGVLLGMFAACAIVGASAVSVALPVVTAELGLVTVEAAWIIAAFVLANAVGTPVAGRAADIHGLRLPIRLGAFLLLVGSLIAATATVLPVLLVGRVLQGLGAGALPVAMFGIVAARFSPRRRAPIVATLSATISFVGGVGPFFAGFLTDVVSWRAAVGFPALAILLSEPVARLAPKVRRGLGELDWRGGILVAGVVVLVTSALQAHVAGVGITGVSVLGVTAIVSVRVLASYIRRRPEGFLPRRVVADPRIMLPAAAAACLFAPFLGIMFAAPLLLAQHDIRSMTMVGLAIVPGAVAGSIAGRLATEFVPRFGSTTVIATVGASSAAGLILVGAWGGHVPALMISVALISVGMSAGNAILVGAVSDVVAEEMRGIALGVYFLCLLIGAGVGPIVVGSLADGLGLQAAVASLLIAPLLGIVAARRGIES